ncbi:MAG: hypothetical protein GY857_09475 [Desulfobacula sp.]|nr:hypothetical protein [Desulfobacula sp.]
MKILDSTISLSSENSLKQMDLSLEEKTEKKITRLIDSNPMDEFSDTPQIFVDRVSISQRKKFEYQYNYSGSLTANSSVKALETGDITDHENQYVIKRLIGGVIDKNVAIRHIQRKEDIRLSDQKNSKTFNPGREKLNIQTVAARVEEMRLMQTDIHFEEENVQFASTGEVTTEDGRVISFSLDISLERSFLSRREEEIIVETWQERIDLTDPLVISLDGKIPQLSDATFEFDLDNDGEMENISFVTSGSGFLAFDKNSDNIINNGSELFGPGTGNGFEELAAFDEDLNNWIDENDAVFSQLSVWTKDANGEDMLVSLKDAGIGAISLANAATTFNMTESDNSLQGQLKSTGVFLFEDGHVGSVHQIDLADRTENISDEKNPQLSADSELKSQFNIPQFFSTPVLMSTQPSLELSSPLQDLLDRLEKLKEEMEQLYESMNPALNQNSFKSSKSHNYFEQNLDMSYLFFGPKDSIQNYGWFV